MPGRQSIAVLDLSEGSPGAAGASVLATLDARRFRRVGLLTDRDEAGAWREGVLDAAALLPAPADGRFTAELVAALQRETVAVVLPGSVPAAFALARSATALCRRGIATPPVLLALLEMLARDGIEESCRLAGVNAGRFLDMSRQRWVEDVEWPLLFLGGDGRRRRARDTWEAIRAHESLTPSGRSIAATHDPDSLFEVALVTGRRHDVLGGAAVRVLADDERARPWLVVTVDNPSLIDAAARLSLALGLYGPAAFLFQKQGDSYLALDAQPGFPLWIELILSGGPHLVELAIAQAAGAEGNDPPAFTPAGIVLSHTSEDHVVDPDHSVLSNLRMRP